MSIYKEGSLSSKIAFIGEAPGEQEVAEGGPFKGSAGQLLNTILHSTSILRTNCYIDNVFQFRPKQNDITPYISWDRGKIKFSPEYTQQSEALYDRLRKSEANVFVPLGNVPLYALTGKWGITKLRGSMLSCTIPGMEGKKVIPTIHPAAAMREYLHRLLIAFDLTRVKQQSLFPELKLPERHLQVTPSYIEALQYIAKAREQKAVGFDIETSRSTHQLLCFSIAISPWDCMSIPLINFGKGDYFDPEKEGKVLQALGKLLEDPNVTKVGQNIIYDSSFMFKRYGIHMQNMDDTMIAMGILYPDYPKDLGIITSLYTEEPYYKDEGKESSPTHDDEMFRRYNAKDSAVCIEAFPKLEKDLATTGNLETYQKQKALIDPLLFIQEHGILIDTKGMAKASFENTQRIEDSQLELDKLCGFPINISSPKQMKEYFYLTRGYKPKYHGDALTVDDDALKKLAAQGSPEARIVQELRHLKKIQSSYYDMMLDTDNRLRSSFNPVGTKQGRVSSSKTLIGTGGNMQNIPKEMKGYMIADPGYIIVNMDLSQAENRVVAYISNELKMIAAFEAGIDLHRLTAALIFHKKIEEVSKEPGSSSIGSGKMSERDWGKRANHALNYDLGVNRFSSMYELTQQESLYIIDAYHRAYPGVRQWHAAVKDKLSKDRRLTNCYGRTRQFRDRWNDDLFKEAYSFIPQSTVADCMNFNGIVWLYKQQQGIFKDIRMLNLVHDSVVFQYPLANGPLPLAQVCLAVKQNLEQPLNWHGREFTIPADTGLGFDMKHLEEFKSKEWKTAEELAEKISHLYV